MRRCPFEGSKQDPARKRFGVMKRKTMHRMNDEGSPGHASGQTADYSSLRVVSVHDVESVLSNQFGQVPYGRQIPDWVDLPAEGRDQEDLGAGYLSRIREAARGFAG